MVSTELTPLFFFGVLFSEAEPDPEADAEAEPWSWSSSMDGMSSMVMGEFVSTQSSEFLMACCMSILGPSLNSLYVRERSMFGCEGA